MSSFDYNDSIDWFNQSLSSDVLDSTPMNWLLLPVGAALAMIVALTIGGNVLILSAVCTNCNLREPTHILIANLAVADLLLGFLVLPFSATLEVTGKWYFGSIFCKVWAAVDVLCCTASILSLCVISVDRYIGITRPLSYHSIVTSERSSVLCVTVWISSIAISIGPLLGWRKTDVYTDNSNSLICTVNTELGYVLFSVVASFYLPTLIILAVYWRIYREAVKQTRFLRCGTKIERSVQSEITLRVHVGRTVQTAPPTQQQQLLVVPNSNSESRKSNAGHSIGLSAKMFKFHHQKKAAKTLGIVVGAFLLCWFPFFIILPIDALCSSCVPKMLFSCCFWLGYCNSSLNPFIYASTSREFKRTFAKILCVRHRLTRRPPLPSSSTVIRNDHS